MARITLNILNFFKVIPGKEHPSYLEMLKVPWPELHWTFFFFNVIPGKVHPSYLEMLKVPWPFTIYLSTTPLICWICKLHWFASLGVPKHINYWGHTCAHLFFLIFLKVADSSLTKVNTILFHYYTRILWDSIAYYTSHGLPQHPCHHPLLLLLVLHLRHTHRGYCCSS